MRPAQLLARAPWLNWGGKFRPTGKHAIQAQHRLLRLSCAPSIGRAFFYASVRQALSAKTSDRAHKIKVSKTRVSCRKKRAQSCASLPCRLYPCVLSKSSPPPLPSHPLLLLSPKTLYFSLSVHTSPSLAASLLIPWQLACGLLSRMKLYGLDPNVVSYGISMDACAKAGRWEKVKSPLACTKLFLPKKSSFAMLRDGDLSRASKKDEPNCPYCTTAAVPLLQMCGVVPTAILQVLLP